MLGGPRGVLALGRRGNQSAPTPAAAAPAVQPTNPVAGWVYSDEDGSKISFLDERRFVVEVPFPDRIGRREELYRLEGNAVIRIGSGEREGEIIDGGQRFVTFMGAVMDRIGRVPAAGLSSTTEANQAP